MRSPSELFGNDELTVVSLHAVFMVGVKQPLGDHAELSVAEARQPKEGRAEAVGLAFEVAELLGLAIAAVARHLLVVIPLGAEGEAFRQKLVHHEVHMELIAGFSERSTWPFRTALSASPW